jgi:hypothetical protein
MLSDDVPDFFLCPISQSVLIDPVVAVDGFTYERESIESWFREQSNNRSFTSPVTGERIQSTLLIQNRNLAKAIAKYIGAQAKKVITIQQQEYSSRSSNDVLSLEFSHWTIGRGLTLDDNKRSVITKCVIPADRVDWYDLIAFSASPSRYTSEEKPRVLFLVEKARTGWGGLTFGFSPSPAEKIDLLCDFVDANCWWIDGSNWFHTPNGGTVLVPWSTSEIRQGDRVGITVPSHGKFCVYVNGVKKVDIKDTDLPVKLGTQLYGFIALTGGYERVRIIQDTPQDWGSS